MKVYVGVSEDEVSSYEQFSRGSKNPIRLGVLNTSDRFRNSWDYRHTYTMYSPKDQNDFDIYTAIGAELGELMRPTSWSTAYGKKTCVIVPCLFKADMVQRFKVGGLPAPGGGAFSVVDIGVGFRDEILRNDYWPMENEAVDFKHLDLATYYQFIGRKDQYAGHSILTLLHLPSSNGLIVDYDHLFKNLIEQTDAAMSGNYKI